ncbi:MAG: hypothetical protein WCY19_00255 [Candidatus Gastranaerophilaceae bacterium]
MREVKNNVEIGKAQKSDLRTAKGTKAEPQFCGEFEEESSIKDFSNPKAEALGRSQVSKTDNVEKDVAFGKAHPETIERADKLFALAFKGLRAAGDPDAYEKACAISTSSDARDLLSK